MRHLILILSLVSIFSGAYAQPGTLEGDLEQLSPANIAEIQELRRFSDARPEGLVWSPDSQTLAVATTSDIRLYDIGELAAPPIIVDSPYAARHTFSTTGELIINNGRAWNTSNGELITGDWSGEIIPSGNLGIVSKYAEGVETTIEIWNIENLDEPLHVLHTGSQERPVFFVGTQLSSDERTLAAMLSDDWNSQMNPRGSITVQLWELENGTLLRSFEMENGGIVEFSPDGAWLVSNTAVDDWFYSTSYPGELNVWDTRTGNVLHSVSSTGVGLAFNHDSRQLAVTLASGEVMVWSEREQITLDGGANIERPLAFSPDGELLATRSNNAEVGIWNLAQQTRITLEHPVSLNGVFFSPDSTLIVTRDQSNDFQLWNAKTGSFLADLGHLDEGITAVFSPDGTKLALGSLFSFTGMQNLWEISGNADEVRRLYQFVYPVQISPDWTHAAYWDVMTTNVRIIELATGEEKELEVLPNYLGGVWAFDANNERAVFSKDGVTIQVVHLMTGELIATFDLERRSAIHVSPDWCYIAVERYSDRLGEPAELFILDIANPEQEPVEIDTTAETWNIEFSPEGATFAVNNRQTGFVELWDTATGMLLATWYTSDALVYHAFSPDGKWLITTSYDSPVTVWDIETILKLARTSASTEVQGVVRLRFDISAFGVHVSPVVFSANGEKFVVQVDSGVYVNQRRQGGLVLLDLAEGLASGEDVITLEPGDTLYAPDAQTGHTFFSPDGRLLVTNRQGASGEFLYDTESGEEVEFNNSVNPYLGEMVAISSFFSSDGSLFGQRTTNGQVIWWDAATLGDNLVEPVFVQDFEFWGEVVGFNRENTLMYVIDNRGIGIWGVPKQT